MRVHQYGLNVSGGVGAGRYRGGYGSVREYEILADDTVLSASYGRSIERPWPMEGGRGGSCNYFELHLGDDTRRAARAPTTVMKRGDRICMYNRRRRGLRRPVHPAGRGGRRRGPRRLHHARAGARGIRRRTQRGRREPRRGRDHGLARGRLRWGGSRRISAAPFTDLVYFDEETGALITTKSLTTPCGANPGASIDTIELAALNPAEVSFFVHGGTTVINAIYRA